MSYALTATKRKFHRILDDISNANTPSSPAKAAETPDGPANEASNRDDAPSNKRRRVSSASQRPSTAERRIPVVPQIVLSRNSPSKRPATAVQDTVRVVEGVRVLGYFAPWDRNQFLCRLQTFTHQNFSAKPEAINEVAWAKRGWSCVDDETTGCVRGCEARVVIDMNIPDLEGEDEMASIESFKARREIG
jgi:hypothetical protein